jgi:hypothetical protein
MHTDLVKHLRTSLEDLQASNGQMYKDLALQNVQLVRFASHLFRIVPCVRARFILTSLWPTHSVKFEPALTRLYLGKCCKYRVVTEPQCNQTDVDPSIYRTG